MKTLLLMRHGKSSWDDRSLADFERPLAQRGVKASKRIGRELASRGWVPTRVLVSPALRTQRTWELVAAELAEAPTVGAVESLYDATPDELLAELQGADETVETLLVIGHNPGLQDLALAVADKASDAKALARLGEKFPTAAVARFVVEGTWQGLSEARLTDFLRPKDLV
ncbi:MAG TPA: histidine phosphatase family protein [Rhizobiaceae bacterium]|nr:histidine phosphatase family protein [Rhizobiaceae bacterium]